MTTHLWIEKIKPILPEIKKSVYDICSYGFTEILNNAVEHAEAGKILVIVEYSPLTIRFMIIDDGIGIFIKIQKKHRTGFLKILITGRGRQ